MFAVALYFGVDGSDEMYDNMTPTSQSTYKPDPVKGYSNAAIDACWKEQARKSLTPGEQ